MKGLGTKEKDLISVLGGFAPLHMNQIINEYQKKYGKKDIYIYIFIYFIYFIYINIIFINIYFY